MKSYKTSSYPAGLLPAVTAALAAAGLITTAHAQVQSAGSLLVSVDATASAPGALSSIPNAGTLGGFLEARGGGTTVPIISNVHGNGTKGIQCSGGQYMQLVPTLGGAVTPPPAGIVGVNPDYSIEAWVMNPVIQDEETVVSWGKRGGPDGSNCSFNYGYDAAWGAMGHWGGPDMGWDSSAAGSGVYPPGVPVAGVWHHLVYTFDGATQRAYADGVLKNSEAVALNLTAGTAITLAAQLEADGVTVTGGLRGSMTVARLRIHDGELTGAQVLNNYNFERGDFSNGGAPLTAGPVHRYSFSNPAGAAASGAVVTDTAGTAHGVVRGAGATFTGTRATIPGGASSTQAYIDLPNGLVSVNSVNNGGNGELTLEGWVKVTGVRNWGPIFDIGSTDIGGGVGGEVLGPGGGGEGRDYLAWTGQVGTDIANQRLELRNEDPAGGGIATIDHPTSSQITTIKDIHIALTWKESPAQLIAYENGSQIATLTPPGNMPMSQLNDVNVWLGRSMWSGDQNMQGEYDEFRIYNKVLTPAQVQASYQAGPNNIATADPVTISTQPQSVTVPELGTATFTIAANGQIPITYQWYRNSVRVNGATNPVYTISPVTLADSGTPIFCIASNNLFSTPFTATSSTATLTVQPDLIAATIARARVAGTNQVEVLFSEAVKGADAAIAANYTVRGPEGPYTVLGAAVGAPDRAVLTLASNLLCAYYSVTASNLHDLSSAMNVSGSTNGFWNFAPPSLTHRYSFNNAPVPNATGATITDLAGSSNGIVINGSGVASFNGDRISLSGGPGAIAPYVDLPNGLLSNNSTNRGGTGQLTFEGWVKITGNHSWSRIFDFGASGGLEVFSPGGGGNGNDYFFYSAMNGTDQNRRRLDKTGSGHDAGVEYGIANFNQDFHYVVTWDEASGAIAVYEDGILTGSMTTGGAMSEVNDVNVWLGRSNWSADENTQGDYDEFRVYNRVLSTNDIFRDRVAGPDMGLGAPSNFDLVITNHDMFTNTSRRVPVLVTFANAGRRDIADSGCVTYQTSDPGVVTVTPDGVLLAHSVGTATVTARFSGFSDSELVNVSADTIPPLLVSARALGPKYIELFYSEPVETASATDPFNYSISSLSGTIQVGAAVQLADKSRVILTALAPMPCEYMTLDASGVADLSPLINVLPAGSHASFLNYSPTSLKHRYAFNDGTGGAPSGTLLRDGVGSADGAVLGAGGQFTGDRVVLPGGSSATAGYIDLPNGLLSVNGVANGGSGEVSLEGWFRNTGNHNWARVFDIGSSISGEVVGPGGGGEGRDYLMLSAQNGGDTGNRRTELRNEDPGGGGTFTVDHGTADFNQDTHYVVTWKESTGLIRTYANGNLVSSMTVPTQMSAINDVNVWLGRSNWTGDENTQGEYDEFRVYNKVLSPAEIAVSRNMGPDNAVGAPTALRIGTPTSLMNVGRTLLPSVFADFATVSNLDVGLGGCATFSSSNPTIISGGTQLLGVAGGSATVTARFNGLTATAVFVVNNPPTPAMDGAATFQGRAVSIAISKLLKNDTDPEGDLPLTFGGVTATSANGGTVVANATYATYTPAAAFSGLDTFTYTVTDSRGGSALGVVQVMVVNGTLAGANQVGITANAGGPIIRFAGIPGNTYQIQRATNPAGPWTTLNSRVAPVHGIIDYQDTNPPQPAGFYRTLSP